MFGLCLKCPIYETHKQNKNKKKYCRYTNKSDMIIGQTNKPITNENINFVCLALDESESL